jgi:hypothetical protein
MTHLMTYLVTHLMTHPMTHGYLRACRLFKGLPVGSSPRELGRARVLKVSNPISSQKRLKHIDIRFHITRDFLA